MISIDDFQKIELRIGKIIAAERVEGSEKLLKLQLDLGGEEVCPPATRQIIAGIGTAYSPEDLVGREVVVIANLEPREIMGHESQGMLLAADSDGGPVFLTPDQEVPPGSRIK